MLKDDSALSKLIALVFRLYSLSLTSNLWVMSSSVTPTRPYSRRLNKQLRSVTVPFKISPGPELNTKLKVLCLQETNAIEGAYTWCSFSKTVRQFCWFPLSMWVNKNTLAPQWVRIFFLMGSGLVPYLYVENRI